MKKICCYLMTNLLLIACLIIFLTLWLTYTYDTLSTLTTVDHVGFNSTSLMDCFDVSITQSIYIEAEFGKDLEYDSHIFIMNKTNLTIVSLDLDSRSRVLKQTDSNINFPINYHYDNNPVYVASTGYLTYHVTITGDTSTSCACEFFSFQSETSYNQFKESNDRHSPIRGSYTESSQCFPHTSSTSTYVSFNFTFTVTGSYYVAAFVAKDTTLIVTIEGTVTSYSIPFSLHEQCWLTSDTRHCTIEMSRVYGQNVCVLSQSNSESSNPVNITVKMVEWYTSRIGILYFILFCAFMSFLFLTNTVALLCKCLRTKSQRCKCCNL